MALLPLPSSVAQHRQVPDFRAVGGVRRSAAKDKNERPAGKKTIAREEHLDIVDFYKKVVAFQRCTIRDLRENIAFGVNPPTSEIERAERVEGRAGNFICVDFRWHC